MNDMLRREKGAREGKTEHDMQRKEGLREGERGGRERGGREREMARERRWGVREKRQATERESDIV